MPEQREKIYIDRVPEEHYGSVVAKLTDPLSPLVTDSIRTSMIKDLEKDASANNRVFIDKDRYFVHSFSLTTGRIFLSGGTYTDFNIARELLGTARDKGRTITYETIFNHPSIKLLGLQNLLTTSEGHFIIGKRGQKVFQAPGALCLPAGGVMPETEEYSGEPDVYLSSYDQTIQELGLDVNKDALSLTAIIRDDGHSPNTSLIFEADLPYDQQQATEAFNEKARDRWEHDGLLFLNRDQVLDQLAEGKFEAGNANPEYPLIRASLGAILNQGGRLRGDDWLQRAKEGIQSFGYEVVQDE